MQDNKTTNFVSNAYIKIDTPTQEGKIKKF